MVKHIGIYRLVINITGQRSRHFRLVLTAHEVLTGSHLGKPFDLVPTYTNPAVGRLTHPSRPRGNRVVRRGLRGGHIHEACRP